MARRNTSFDEAKIARFEKEGRGQGRGADYKPWLTTYDVPSAGREHRVFGSKVAVFTICCPISSGVYDKDMRALLDSSTA